LVAAGVPPGCGQNAASSSSEPTGMAAHGDQVLEDLARPVRQPVALEHGAADLEAHRSERADAQAIVRPRPGLVARPQVQHDAAFITEWGPGEPGIAARSVDQQLADDVAAGADGLGDAAGFQCRPGTAAPEEVAASRRSIRRDLAEQSLGGGVSRGEPPLGVEDHDAGGQMLQHSRGWELRGHGWKKRRRSRKPAPIAETFRAVDMQALVLT
jgi:hypothetical protein